MATMTLYPSYGCRVTQASPASNARGTLFNVGKSSGGLEGRYYCYFDLSYLKNNNCDVDSATFYINQYDDPNDWGASVNVDIRKVNSSWSASSITWNNAPGYGGALDGALSFSGIATRTLALRATETVKSAVAGTNYGFLIAAIGSANSTAKYFRSDTYGTVGERPRLLIDYTEPRGHVNVNGVFRKVISEKVNIDGTFRTITAKKVNVNSSWKSV